MPNTYCAHHTSHSTKALLLHCQERGGEKYVTSIYSSTKGLVTAWGLAGCTSQRQCHITYLSWRTSFCTSSRDFSNLSLSCLHSHNSDFKALTVFCSTTSSFRTLFAFSCSSLRVLCRSLAIHFSCSTLYASNSTKKEVKEHKIALLLGPKRVVQVI